MSAKAISESPYHVKLKGEKSRRKKKAFRAKEAPPPASPGKRDLLDDHDLVPVEFEAGGEDGTSWFDHLETLEETAKSQSLSLIGVFTGKQKLDLDGDGDADVWDRSAVIGKYLNSTATAFFALWVWVGFGTIFGMVSQKWTFVRSVYFSVAAMSTAGLQAPNTLGDGDMDDSVAWFVSIFCVFGIPIFGVAVGRRSSAGSCGAAAEDKPFEVLIDALDSPDKPDKPDKPASPASRVTPQDK
ncbi:spermidine synthase [Aureococcus anophagefferens]|nr:spermidine synthase [Aureococcus anophagefferens]